MKIILEGLGMKSEIMCVPEDTSRIFHITTLTQHAPFGINGEFEWKGEVDSQTGARIYVLRDITKSEPE